MEQYKDEIQKTFSFLLSPEIKWEFQGEGRYTWKTLTKQETLVSCDAHRLFLLLSDHHYITLYRWLPGARKDYEVAETYETEDGIIYRMRDGEVKWIHVKRGIILWPRVPRGIWIKPIDGKKSFVIEIGVTLSARAEAERVKLAESLANDTPRFLHIYNPWKCSLCGKMVPPHELYCRACKKERYARCNDLQCFEPQRIEDKRCYKCGGEISHPPREEK